MSTIDEINRILQEPDNFSDLSAEPSFTLSDILEEPIDQQVQAFQRISEQQEDWQAYFQENQEEPEPIQPYSNIKEMEKIAQKRSSSDIFVIEKKETNMSALQNTKYVVTRWRRLKDLPLPPSEEIQNMLYISLQNVSKIFDLSSTRGVGIPTCISATGTRFLALGTSLGNTVVFEVEVKGHKQLNTQDQQKFGQVTSVSVSRDNRYLVCGHQSGLIVVWDLMSFKVIKKELLHKHRILKVLFCENYENFVTSDAQGNVYMFTIENYLWTGVRHQLLIDRTENIYYDLKFSKLKSGRHLLTLCSLSSIVLISLKPSIGVLGAIKRPDGISADKVPNCQIGQYLFKDKRESMDFVCVSWGKTIFIYRLIPNNHSMEEISMHFKIEHPSIVENIQLISNGVLVTLDDRQVFRVINISESKDKQKCISVSTDQLQTQTIYQRFIKSTFTHKYIKTYANTIVNCSFNKKNKEIFLIGKNNIYRGRLQKWTDHVYNLLTKQRNLQRALKMCLQLYNGNYNIFAQPFTVSKTSISVLCDIGKMYLKEKMKEIQSKNLQQFSIKYTREEAEEVFDTIIEFYSSINQQKFLFNNIFPYVEEKYFYEYEELLYQCLQPAIQNNAIKHIPNREIFTKIVHKFSDQPKLLNRMLINLEQESLFYEEIIDVCENQKLFEALCYMCAVNGDFISPPNKIMTHLMSQQDEQAKKTLDNYLNHLLSMKYPNQKPVHVDRRIPMLQSLAAWLTCDEALQFLVGCYGGERYLYFMRQLRQNLLKYGLNQSVDFIVQQLLQQKSQQIFKKHEKLLCLCIQLTNTGLQSNFNFKIEVFKNIMEVIKVCANEEKKLPQTIIICKLLKKYVISYQQKLNEFDIEPNDRNQNQLQKFIQNQIFAQISDQSIIRETQLCYYILKESSVEKIYQVFRRPKNGVKRPEETLIIYLLKNISEQSRHRYLQIFLQQNLSATLLQIVRSNSGGSLDAINKKLVPQALPDDKLRYLVTRRLLKVTRKSERTVRKSFSLDPKILVSYMESLCKYKNQKRVFAQLIQYPEEFHNLISDIVPIVEKYQYCSCLGYLYERQFLQNQAFLQYSKVYASYFHHNFYKLLNHKHCHGRFMSKIYNYMLALCERLNSQSQWGELLKAVFSPFLVQERIGGITSPAIDTIQRIYEIETMRDHPFMTQLKQTLQSTIGVMSRAVTIQFMAGELNKYSSLMNKTFILNCLTSALNDCNRRVQTFCISRNLMVQQFVKDFSFYFKQYKLNAASFTQECQRCNRDLMDKTKLKSNDTKVLGYSCGHAYHLSCNEKQCKKCAKIYYGDYSLVDPLSDPTNILYSQTQSVNSSKITTISMSEEQIQQTEEDMDMKNVYKCLAFDDYIKRKQNIFKDFQESYESYIDKYRTQTNM